MNLAILVNPGEHIRVLDIPRPQCAFRRFMTKHSFWVVDVVDNFTPPQMDTLALFHSTSLSVPYGGFSWCFSPARFHHPSSSLDNPHHQKFSTGTASIIINLTFIISYQYIWDAFKFTAYYLFHDFKSFDFQHFSVITLFAVRLASHAFMNRYACLLDAKARSNTRMVHG